MMVLMSHTDGKRASESRAESEYNMLQARIPRPFCCSFVRPLTTTAAVHCCAYASRRATVHCSVVPPAPSIRPISGTIQHNTTQHNTVAATPYVTRKHLATAAAASTQQHRRPFHALLPYPAPVSFAICARFQRVPPGPPFSSSLTLGLDSPAR
jgi:hypothetical protein